MSGQKPKSQAGAVPKMVNKKAFYDYEIIEKVEAGISLVGTEVKSLRAGGADLTGSFARIIDEECWLVGCNIAPYEQAGVVNHNPLRKRKLLLHRAQIRKLAARVEQKGFTLIPLRIYFGERGYAKVELAVGRGKRKYDKREKIQRRQQEKDIDRGVKRYR